MKYTLHIDDRVYEVPEKLTIKQFKELANWDIRLEQNWRKVMSIVMNVPYEDVSIIPEKTIEVAIAFLIERIYPNTAPVKNGIIDINNVSVGTFVDMEVLINGGLQKNIYGIIELLYGIKATDDLLLYDYYGGITYYLNWRLNIFNSYRKLFGLDDEYSKNDIELEKKVDPAYNWYAFIMVLCNDDFLKIDEVVEKPIIQALNYLAYIKDKKEEENKRINELQRSSRLN